MKKSENKKYLFSNLSKEAKKLNRLLLEVSWESANFDDDYFKDGLEHGAKYLNEEQKTFLTAIVEIIPELRRILRCRQHLTHDYCLDVHTLSVIKKIREFENFKNANDYEKLILLYSALLHDIEKFENEVDPEHPVRGAKKSSAILFRLGFEEDFINSVYLLIKHHQVLGLLVSEKISFSKEELAGIFRDARLLELQAMLSIADIKSVKKKELFLGENMEKKLKKIICEIKKQL